MPTFYVTKYALTDGIKEMQAVRFSDDGKRAYGKLSAGDHFDQGFSIGSEAFPTRDDALANVEKRRTKKIESLNKQIAKLEKLKF